MLIGLWALTLMAVLAALVLHAPARSHGLALAAAVLASLTGMWQTWRIWRAQLPGELIWNGAEWLLMQGGVTTAIAQPAIRCDGQRWFLLRTRAERGARWLWVGRAADPARWHGLRCALCARTFVPEATA
jgi:hypothetical protein